MKRCVILLTVLACAVLTSNAQKKQLKPVYSTAEIDLAAAQLPSHYLGNSVWAVYVAQKQRESQRERGEYETTAQYEARQARLDATPLVGSLTRASRFAFAAESLGSAYDADAGRLRLALNADVPDWDHQNECDPRAVSISHVSASEVAGSFIGSNSFGVRMRVTRKLEMSIEIWLPKLCLINQGVAELPATPAWAKANRGRLRGILIGRLRSPFTGGVELSESATLDNPEQVETRRVAVYFNPEEFWIYDFESGAVLHRQPLVCK